MASSCHRSHGPAATTDGSSDWIVDQPDLGLGGSDHPPAQDLGQELSPEAHAEDRDVAFDRRRHERPLPSHPGQPGVVDGLDRSHHHDALECARIGQAILDPIGPYASDLESQLLGQRPEDSRQFERTVLQEGETRWRASSRFGVGVHRGSGGLDQSSVKPRPRAASDGGRPAQKRA